MPFIGRMIYNVRSMGDPNIDELFGDMTGVQIGEGESINETFARMKAEGGDQDEQLNFAMSKGDDTMIAKFLEEVLKPGGPLEDIWGQLDANGDGVLQFEEMFNVRKR